MIVVQDYVEFVGCFVDQYVYFGDDFCIVVDFIKGNLGDQIFVIDQYGDLDDICQGYCFQVVINGIGYCKVCQDDQCEGDVKICQGIDCCCVQLEDCCQVYKCVECQLED